MARALRRFAAQAAVPLSSLVIAHAADVPAGHDVLSEVVVTAPYGQKIARDRVPARVQSATVADIQALQPLDVTDLLNRDFGSVSINQAQNNPLQPDVNFRGQTASPLLGMAQGLSVYADGVRLNETFGDTVNWDLLPLSAVYGVQLLSGTNPVFGLNSLGGALSLTMKNGFNTSGTALDALAGSFGRRTGSLQGGGNNGHWGWYGDVDYFHERGWRAHSNSTAVRGYGALSWRSGEDSFDLSYTHANSDLRGNGASPAELVAVDRSAVFTWPDRTENHLNQLIATGSKALGAGLKLSGNLFYRQLRTGTFNGDSTSFAPCDIGGQQLLVDQDFVDVQGDGICSQVDGYTLVLDQHGDPIPVQYNAAELDAINNISHRDQHSYGASLQLGHELLLGGQRRNNLTLGAAWQHGSVGFVSSVEVASLTPERGTTRTGIYAPDYGTDVHSGVGTLSIYAADTLDLSRQVSLTAAARYDHTRIALTDRSGLAPELDGSHPYGRINPALGLAWRGSHGLLVYGNLSQASRAPTAVELACADASAPCNLPNAFLADPPLQDVVARSAEIGARGVLGPGLHWQAGAYQMVNRHDILFQTTGGALSNEGFFQNVGDTRRRGLELQISRNSGAFSWSLDYSLVDATYQDSFIVNSPNHPLFGAAAAAAAGATRIVGADKLQVEPGDRLPGIARHQANLSLQYRASAGVSVGTDVEYRSGVSLRGDEINALGTTPDYAVINLHGEFRVNAALTLYGRIENLFNAKYTTFGLLGQPDEVFAQYHDPRFYGVGPPRGAWLGLRLQL